MLEEIDGDGLLDQGRYHCYRTAGSWRAALEDMTSRAYVRFYRAILCRRVTVPFVSFTARPPSGDRFTTVMNLARTNGDVGIRRCDQHPADQLNLAAAVMRVGGAHCGHRQWWRCQQDARIAFCWRSSSPYPLQHRRLTSCRDAPVQTLSGQDTVFQSRRLLSQLPCLGGAMNYEPLSDEQKSAWSGGNASYS